MERRRKTRWSRFRGVCDQKGLSGRRCGFGLLITSDWLIIKKKEANMCTVNPDLNIFGFPQPTPDSLYPITCSLVVLETLLFSTPTRCGLHGYQVLLGTYIKFDIRKLWKNIIGTRRNLSLHRTRHWRHISWQPSTLSNETLRQPSRCFSHDRDKEADVVKRTRGEGGKVNRSKNIKMHESTYERLCTGSMPKRQRISFLFRPTQWPAPLTVLLPVSRSWGQHK